jgi:GDPmannose 4,6-dehydratase
MKRAAITGIAGQDGTYLARWLLRKGYAVHGMLKAPFDREEPRLRRRFPAHEIESIHWHSGTLADPFSLVRFLKAAQPDEIYHLAGVSDSRHSFDVPEETLISIAVGSLRLLEAAREVVPQCRIFLASSAEVFGLPATVPQDENTSMQPTTPYGIAKLAADQLGRLHREKYGQHVSVGILYNHESPLRPSNYLSSRVARAVAAIKQGRSSELQLIGLDAQRDWSDARDFIRGFWLALQAERPADYVFASGVQRRVVDLVACAFQSAGLDYRDFVKVATGAGNVRQVAAGLHGNPRKAETTLGWQREWSFQETIADIVHAELENRPDCERSVPVMKSEPALPPESSK